MAELYSLSRIWWQIRNQESEFPIPFALNGNRSFISLSFREIHSWHTAAGYTITTKPVGGRNVPRYEKWRHLANDIWLLVKAKHLIYIKYKQRIIKKTLLLLRLINIATYFKLSSCSRRGTLETVHVTSYNCYKAVCLSVCLVVCMSVCLSVCHTITFEIFDLEISFSVCRCTQKLQVKVTGSSSRPHEKNSVSACVSCSGYNSWIQSYVKVHR